VPPVAPDLELKATFGLAAPEDFNLPEPNAQWTAAVYKAFDITKMPSRNEVCSIAVNLISLVEFSLVNLVWYVAAVMSEKISVSYLIWERETIGCSLNLLSPCSFRYAAPHLWNKLPPSLRVPCQSATSECSPPSPGSDSAPKSVVCVSHRVFHSRLKTHLFSRSFPL